MEALWVLQIEDKAKTVKTNQIARLLEVKASSVTEALGKLEKKGWIKHEKYYGVSLTGKGKMQAEKAIRRHRLAEKLLIDILRVNPKHVEKTACGFEHYLDKNVEARLCEILNHPNKCIHGKNIPKGKCCKK